MLAKGSIDLGLATADESSKGIPWWNRQGSVFFFFGIGGGRGGIQLPVWHGCMLSGLLQYIWARSSFAQSHNKVYPTPADGLWLLQVLHEYQGPN
jgi:hypothetical protein